MESCKFPNHLVGPKTYRMDHPVFVSSLVQNALIYVSNGLLKLELSFLFVSLNCSIVGPLNRSFARSFALSQSLDRSIYGNAWSVPCRSFKVLLVIRNGSAAAADPCRSLEALPSNTIIFIFVLRIAKISISLVIRIQFQTSLTI